MQDLRDQAGAHGHFSANSHQSVDGHAAERTRLGIVPVCVENT
jgi:hypothetical protein